MRSRVVLAVLLVLSVLHVRAQYIHQVFEYKPAPGQYVNKAPWGVPQSANSIIGGITGSLTLGAFGGYVIFSFEEPVQNHPQNPYGIDFTIFGNPVGTQAEHGIVWVMKDVNENGLPDDTWYELAGSDYFFSSTIQNYEVTYTNPKADVAADVPWIDNLGNTGYIYTNTFNTQPYYPLVELFPHIDNDSYSLSGTKVQDEVYMHSGATMGSKSKAFGYADSTPRGSGSHTLPNNPYTSGIENSGGDGFDISWAVDYEGNYVDLDEIHFIKVQTAVLAHAGWLGEISTEVTGAAVVEPNPSVTGELDLVVIKSLPDTIVGENYQLEAFTFHMGRRTPERTLVWQVSSDHAWVDDSNMLHFTKSGEVTLTASINQRPQISATTTLYLKYGDGSTSVDKSFSTDLKVYPNPVTNYLYIKGVRGGYFQIYSILGRPVSEQKIWHEGDPIDVSNLSKGIYLVRITEKGISTTLRFVKN